MGYSLRTLALVGVTAIVFIFAGWYYWSMMRPAQSSGGQAALPMQPITIGGTTVTAEIASTDQERKAGLSGRSSLTEGTGMLFIFSKDGDWGIWMPNMRFSIDIVWVDSAGKIVAVDGNISPATYPTVFYPNNNARYVLELPAGYAQAHKITVGGTMSLPK